MHLGPEWFNRDNFYYHHSINRYIIGPLTIKHIMKEHSCLYLPFIANNKKVFYVYRLSLFIRIPRNIPLTKRVKTFFI